MNARGAVLKYLLPRMIILGRYSAPVTGDIQDLALGFTMNVNGTTFHGTGTYYELAQEE